MLNFFGVRIFLLFTCAIALLAGCTIPRSGFSPEAIFSKSEQDSVDLVPISNQVISQYRKSANGTFSSDLISEKEMRSDILDTDDRITLTIWEPNSPSPTFSGSVGGRFDLGEITVDENGYIYVPYAGRIRAAGRTIDQLRAEIILQLKRVVLTPQVSIQVVERASKLITIHGLAGKGGTFPMDRKLRRLSQALAIAAPDQKNPEMTQISLRRDGASANIRLSDLYRNAQLDIALRPGDSIVVSEVVESINILGAASVQGQYRIPKRNFNLLDALALARGLDDDKADPRAVFVFKYDAKHSKIVEADSKSVIYQADLSKPETVFLARQMPIDDGDVIYVGDASLTELKKVVSAINMGVLSATRVADAVAQ